MRHSDSTAARAKVELERQLRQHKRIFGFSDEAIAHLVETSRVIVWERDRPICLSNAKDGMINFLVQGVGAVEMIPNCPKDWFCTANTSLIFKFLAPAEFFCLTPPPRDESYQLRAVPYPRSNGHAFATVALWSHSAVEGLMKKMSPQSYMALLTSSWISLSRVAEERALLLGVKVEPKIRYLLSRLATRFGCKHDLGRLIDLCLPDEIIARMTGSTRSTVNRLIHEKLYKEILRTEGDGIVLRDNFVGPTPAATRHLQGPSF